MRVAEQTAARPTSSRVAATAEKQTAEAGSVMAARHRDHRFPSRRRSVLARYDDEEFAAVALAAGRAGLTPSGFVAATALAAARGTVPPVPSTAQQALQELMVARAQVRRFGSNVNQAVATLNATGEPPEWLGRAVEVTSRAVARVDEAAEAMMRRRP